jgi:hypothetical protein
MPNSGAWPLRINHFAERYPAAENDPDECIIRGDDAEIDIFFESKETEDIYIYSNASTRRLHNPTLSLKVRLNPSFPIMHCSRTENTLTGAKRRTLNSKS